MEMARGGDGVGVNVLGQDGAISDLSISGGARGIGSLLQAALHISQGELMASNILLDLSARSSRGESSGCPSLTCGIIGSGAERGIGFVVGHGDG
ncbi:hypothetical protein GUJ93_ZPchr0012g22158 [Zizania palustris]|uniref:Uncharacterized protein n=1 Tax=Zizania palustris TaxID=103762 RepID=A0A8J6BSC1_ZIZPA|nr:hypothetical protein GUJ93_ZPchr0012g22158 [Zizania palustris]